MERIPLHIRLRAFCHRQFDRMSNAWGNITYPFEYVIGLLLHRALVREESGDAPGRFGRIRGRVLFVLFATGRFMRRIAERLTWPLEIAIGWTSYQAFRLAEWLNLDRLAWWIARLSWPIWAPVVALLRFFAAWITTRELRHLLLAIPALLLLAPVLAGVARGFIGSGVGADYRKAYRAAIAEKNYEAAAIYERKLAQLELKSGAFELRAAEELEKQGDVVAAFERLALLTKDEGHLANLQVHGWLLERLLKAQAGTIPELAEHLGPDRTTDEISWHLDRIEALGHDNANLRAVRAQQLAQAERYLEAAETLAPVAATRVDLAVQYLRLALRSGDSALAQAAVEVADHKLEEVYASGKEIPDPYYRLWVTATERNVDDRRRRFERLKTLVRRWSLAHPESEGHRRMADRLESRELDFLVRSDDGDPYRLAELLMKQLAAAPQDPRIVRSISKVIGMNRTKQFIDETVFILERQEGTPISILEIIAHRHVETEQWTRAIETMRRIVANDPSRSISWNNLAWILAHQPNPQPRLALEAVTRALADEPTNHRFRETRGQVYLRSERWQEAIEDLEYALNGLPDHPAVLESLVKAHEAVGNRDLAESYRRRIAVSK